jgi:hypothetical protein
MILDAKRPRASDLVAQLFKTALSEQSQDHLGDTISAPCQVLLGDSPRVCCQSGQAFCAYALSGHNKGPFLKSELRSNIICRLTAEKPLDCEDPPNFSTFRCRRPVDVSKDSGEPAKVPQDLFEALNDLRRILLRAVGGVCGKRESCSKRNFDPSR